tara:strand:- start:1007 stop:1690 length:684 start_codon:yes stop_codon:yes gene_type:complete
MNDIKKNIENVRNRIKNAADCNGRDSTSISLLAVTKTKPTSMIRQAFDAGCKSFGENYLQDALPKIHEMRNLDIDWHYIGKLQSNKTADIARNFDWVHSLDQFKHAEKLSSHRINFSKPLQCCLQINLTGEASKGGIPLDSVSKLAKKIKALPNLNLRGLMTIPDPQQTEDQQLHTFIQLAKLKDDLNRESLNLDVLSIGMSRDLDLAIRAGSTIVRIGTDIFGARD